MALSSCTPQPAEIATGIDNVIPRPLLVEPRTGAFSLPVDIGVSMPANAELSGTLDLFDSLLPNHTISLTDRDTAHLVLEISTAQALEERFAGRGTEATDESYALEVDAQRIRVTASAPAGLFYGLTTLWQLIDNAENNAELSAVEVLDTPRFVWRGVMLDSARHMQSTEFIKRYLDWMALHKLNMFHWHLTDDQAWRLEIAAYPRLAEVGGWRVPAGAVAAADLDPATGQPRRYGGFYSQDEVRDIVAHAAARHISVVPEIDVPGHATAAIAAYPELGVEGHHVDSPSASWGIFDNVFNLEESTFEFLEVVLAEVVELFPGEYIHLGGDEVVVQQWESSPRIAERMRELDIEGVEALQNYYVERLQRFLSQYDRTVIGWDEIVESDLPPEAAVMSWRGIDGAIAAAAKGHRTVLSPAPTFYLDHVQSNAPGVPPGRGGAISANDIYTFDLLPDALRQNERYLLGVQGNLWTEHVRTEQRVVYMSFPRILAIAELGWSAADRLDAESFSRRLNAHGTRLEALGIRPEDALQRLPAADGRKWSRELQPCSNSIVLALEDDAPLTGERASFLVDIMNPCWQLEGIDTANAKGIQAAVGQLPFNFEIGDMIDDVVVEPPRAPGGELLVRAGGCDGAVVAALPLAPAAGNEAVTELAPRPLKFGDISGVTDLCLSFTREGVAPIWALDWVRLLASDPGASP